MYRITIHVLKGNDTVTHLPCKFLQFIYMEFHLCGKISDEFTSHIDIVEEFMEILHQ